MTTLNRCISVCSVKRPNRFNRFGKKKSIIKKGELNKIFDSLKSIYNEKKRETDMFEQHCDLLKDVEESTDDSYVPDDIVILEEGYFSDDES